MLVPLERPPGYAALRSAPQPRRQTSLGRPGPAPRARLDGSPRSHAEVVLLPASLRSHPRLSQRALRSSRPVPPSLAPQAHLWAALPPSCRIAHAPATSPSPPSPQQASVMARGLSREQSQAKNAAKVSGKGASKKNDDNLTPAQRNERDAKLLAEKKAAKEAAKATGQVSAEELKAEEARKVRVQTAQRRAAPRRPAPPCRSDDERGLCASPRCARGEGAPPLPAAPPRWEGRGTHSSAGRLREGAFVPPR